MIMVPGDAISAVGSRLPRSSAGRRPRVGDAPAAERLTLHEARDRFERDLILRTLAEQQGNMSRTAEVLGVERSNLYRKMRAFGIAARAARRVGAKKKRSRHERGRAARRCLENLIGAEVVAAADDAAVVPASAAAGTSPTISLSSDRRRRARAASRADGLEHARMRRPLVVRSGSSTPGRCRGLRAAAQRLHARADRRRSRGRRRRSPCATSRRSVARLTL